MQIDKEIINITINFFIFVTYFLCFEGGFKTLMQQGQ